MIGGVPGRRTAQHVLAGVAAGCGLVAYALQRGLAFATADSLISGLISTERLTFFYWGQDRLANVVPALAWPVRDLRANHLVQIVLLGASFVSLIGLFVWFHLHASRRPATWPVLTACTAVTGAIAISLLDRHAVFTLVLEQQYALSTVMYLTGLAAVSHTGAAMRVGGLGMMTLATLIIPPVVFLAPLVVVIRVATPLTPRLTRAGVASVCAVAASASASAALGDDFALSDAYTEFSVRRLWRGLPHVLNGIVDSTLIGPTVVVGAACLAVVIGRWRETDWSVRIAYALAGGVTAMWTVLFSANAWVEINQFSFRYFFPVYASGLFVLAGAVSQVGAWAIERNVRSSSDTPATSARHLGLHGALAIVATAWLVSAASTIRIPALEDGRGVAALARTQDARVVVGDYWRVWPAMFAARLEGNDLYAVAFRTSAITSDIAAIAEDGPLAVLCLMPSSDECLNSLIVETGLSWTLSSVVSERPLVLTAAISR